ncbi:helix-turn-helix transcriptional regulator, partial [Acinetobacter baumannii]
GMPKRAIFAPTNRLREIREKKGLSLREVVEGLGSGTPTWLSRLEIGGRDLKLEDAKALARFFEIPVADLFLLADGGLREDEREVIETLR